VVDVNAYVPTRDGDLSISALIATGGATNTPAVTDGTYSARVVSVSSQNIDVAVAGVKAAVRTRTKFVIEGRGMAPNGVTESVVRASFTALSERATVDTAAGTAGLESGAVLQSNAGVRLLTDGSLKLRDPSAPLRTQAGILANGGIGWQTVSRARSSVTESTALDITQGQLFVPASPHPAYSATTGTTGLGNDNGTTNFRTATGSGVVSGLLGGLTGSSTPTSVIGLSSMRRFPDASQASGWKTTWTTAAKSGTGTIAGISHASQAPSSNGERRLTAPLYVDGDLSLSSTDALYLQPPTSSGSSKVIYVHGNVTLSDTARLYNRGVLLVVEGCYLDASDSALYSLLGTGGPYALNTSGLYAAGGLVSLAAVPNAVPLNTSAAGPCGLIYAVSGGITVHGNTEARGAFVAGGLGEYGGLSIEPRNGSAFTIWYRSEALEGRSDLKLGLTVSGTVTIPFTASQLSEWVQVK